MTVYDRDTAQAAAVVDLIVDALDHHPAVDHGADVPAGEVTP